jgi:hypothetical protein
MKKSVYNSDNGDIIVSIEYFLSREAEGFGPMKLQQPLRPQEGATSNKMLCLER